MQVLVTGASGFIGAALTDRLLARGHRVRALVRASSRVDDLRRLGVELAPGDVCRPETLPAAVAGCELVLHCAGLVKALGTDELFRANAAGTRHLAEACAAAPRPPTLVYVSSLAAAGPSPGGRPRTEEDPPAPVSRYGESKLAGEEAVRALAGRLPASIVRPPVVYGPRDRELMPQLLRMAQLGLVVRAGGEKRYSVVHVADLCDGVLAIAERGRRVGPPGPEGVYFLDDGGEHTWDEIALAACAAAGRRARVVALPEATSTLVTAGASLWAALTRTPTVLSLDKLAEMRQAAWTCSSARAAREVGYAPRLGLAEGMRDAVAWFRTRRSGPATSRSRSR
jgi:dihydroflavonol-4-reductase